MWPNSFKHNEAEYVKVVGEPQLGDILVNKDRKRTLLIMDLSASAMPHLLAALQGGSILFREKGLKTLAIFSLIGDAIPEGGYAMVPYKVGTKEKNLYLRLEVVEGHFAAAFDSVKPRPGERLVNTLRIT